MWQELLTTSGFDIQIDQIVIDTRNPLSLSEFETICREHPDLRLEQRGAGELVIVAPHGGESSNVSTEISHQLKVWVKQTRVGKVFDCNALYLLPDDSKLSPDVSLVIDSKWKAMRKPERQGFMPVVPDFIIEVRSPSDRMRALQTKMRDWMQNGVQLGWLIDVDGERVWIYDAHGETEQVLPPRLTGSGPVDGFVLSMQDVYDSLA